MTDSNLFLRLTGTHRVRLVARPIRYLQHWEPIRAISPGVGADGTIIDPLMAMGHVPKPRYSVWVFDRNDDNRLKVMDFPRSLHEVFGHWQQEFGALGGANGPDFQVSVLGTGIYRKYEATALDRTPFTEEERHRIITGDIKARILALRREDTPDEIRAKLVEAGHKVPDAFIPPKKRPTKKRPTRWDLVE